MARFTPSSARRARMSAPTPRLTPSRSPKATLRTRFNRVHPVVAKRTGAGSSASPSLSCSGIRAVVDISSDHTYRTITSSHIGAETLDRWAMIQAGQLPEDDDTPRAPDEETVAEAENDGLAQIQAWGEARNGEIIDEARSEVANLEAQAESLRESPAPNQAVRAANLRAAQRLDDDAEDVVQEARAALARIAEIVREDREAMRVDLMQWVEQRREAERERVEELQRGLHDEIQMTISKRYFGVDIELDSYDLL